MKGTRNAGTPLREGSRNVDAVNRATMSESGVVDRYAKQNELSPPERALLDLITPEAKGRPLLDIGVGGGRTSSPLMAISPSYVGIDYEPKMVAICRRKFPGTRFETADARDLSRFADRSFFLVVFSCNGLGMVGHAGRLDVLGEVFRVLEPGGAFLFSTHNQHSPDHDAGLQWPRFEPAVNPLRLGLRVARFAREAALSVYNRRRFQKLEERRADYSIVNDRCHNYGTMLYYISLANQRAQLERTGFAPGALAYDLAGKQIAVDTTDSSIMLLARKPA